MQLTTLVGRAREVAEIWDRLAQPAVRLLTIVGAGGMDKTKLALAVGQAFLDVDAQLAEQPNAPSLHLHLPPHWG
ncbi:MAG: hypothetical protein NT075_18305 [Chloroflexi bacterium]|nr:hypothetical protein [Chloroflexota bacterium]